jgi:hypothetical protein
MHQITPDSDKIGPQRRGAEIVQHVHDGWRWLRNIEPLLDTRGRRFSEQLTIRIDEVGWMHRATLRLVNGSFQPRIRGNATQINFLSFTEHLEAAAVMSKFVCGIVDVKIQKDLGKE